MEELKIELDSQGWHDMGMQGDIRKETAELRFGGVNAQTAFRLRNKSRQSDVKG